MAEPGDGLGDLPAIDQGDHLLARAQLLDRQFPLRGPDHRAARVADGLDCVPIEDLEGCPGSNVGHVEHGERGAAAGFGHRQPVKDAAVRHRVADGEALAVEYELVAGCDVCDVLGRGVERGAKKILRCRKIDNAAANILKVERYCYRERADRQVAQLQSAAVNGDRLGLARQLVDSRRNIEKTAGINRDAVGNPRVNVGDCSNRQRATV